LVLQKDKQNWQTIRERERETQQIKLERMKKRDITNDVTERQSIIRNYFEKTDANKLEDQEEMDKFWIHITYQN
jgi:hypothetical protein